MDLKNELDELEENFSKTEQEFEKIRDDNPDSKQQRAEELITEIQEQLEFLRDQVD